MVSPQRLHVDTARRLPLPAARVDRENTAKFLADNNIDADMELPPRRQVQLAGHVGAGAEVFPDDNGGTGLEYVEPAFPVPDDAVCVVVRGNSMYPRYFDGELIYYRSVPVPPEQALGRECVVRLVDAMTAAGYTEQQARNVEQQEDAWDSTIGEWLSATMGGERVISEQGKPVLLPSDCSA